MMLASCCHGASSSRPAPPSLSLLSKRVDDQSDAVDACIGTLRDVKEAIEHLQLLVVERERGTFSPSISPLPSPSALPNPNSALIDQVAQVAKTASDDISDLTELAALLQEDVNSLRSQLRAKKILDSPDNASWAKGGDERGTMTESGVIEQVLISQSSDTAPAPASASALVPNVEVDFHLDLLNMKRSIQELTHEIKEVKEEAAAAAALAAEAQDQASSALQESEAPIAQLAFLGASVNSLNESLDEVKSILDQHEERLLAYHGVRVTRGRGAAGGWGDGGQGDRGGEGGG